MSEVVYGSAEDCNNTLSRSLEVLNRLKWQSWVSSCHAACSDFPSAEARTALGDLQVALFLLGGRTYRDLLEDL